MNPFSEGQWILWTTPHHAKRGRVLVVLGPSLVVRWLDGEEQVFPVVEAYVGPLALGDARMEVIERPREAGRIEREQARGVMSVQRAASSLGTTPKRIRAMLRSGQLQGTQRDGKWIHVEL